MSLREEAEKEVERIKKIMKDLKVLDKSADSLVKVMESYYNDSIAFFEKEKYLQSLETAFIVWAYVDAGLHLKIFKVPENLRNIFTANF